MTRGRRPIPDAIKALKGNPGGRKLILDELTGVAPQDSAPQLPIVHLRAEPPAFLTTDRERAIFRAVLETLPGSIAKASDTIAIGRYCAHLRRWADLKVELDENPSFYETESSKVRMWRRHPAAAEIVVLEAILIKLEDRLCLNIRSRHAAIERMFESPAAPQPHSSEPADEDESPLAFLQRHETKPN